MPHLFPIMGSKRLLKPRILPALSRSAADGACEYREPFAGAAHVGVTMMSYRPDWHHWINDADPAIACLWRAVKDYPQEIVRRVRDFRPTVAKFREFQRYLAEVRGMPADDDDESLAAERPDCAEGASIIEVGFRRLALAYMYHSGNGSGCRGGYTQTNGRIDERWSPERICRKVGFHHRRLCRIGARVTCEDFQTLIDDTSRRALLYCDPPYRGFLNYYGCRFSTQDDQRLADLLGTTEHAWVLTYGDHPAIRRLYSGWARVEEIGYRNLLITR
jgi:site-specific DNA-adenine methylase